MAYDTATLEALCRASSAWQWDPLTELQYPRTPQFRSQVRCVNWLSELSRPNMNGKRMRTLKAS